MFSVMDNATVVRTLFEEFFNKGDEDVVKDLVADVYDFHNGPADVPRTREAFVAGTRFMRASVPDMHWEISLLVAVGDLVVVRSTLTGTHAGDFLGVPATGRQILVRVADFYRLEGGKIREHWDVVDNLAALLRLGAGVTPEVSESAEIWGLLALQ
jgi:steroid delta-isomerase-like uncharacterized protein